MVEHFEIMNSFALPASLAAIALVLAVSTSYTMDCRRHAPTLWLKRSASPVYYWFTVAILAGIVGLGIWLMIRSPIEKPPPLHH